MSKVYISSVETLFGKALAEKFAENGFEVLTEPADGLEYFIDLTDADTEGDDLHVGEGLNMETAVHAYHENISIPFMRLNGVLPSMTGKKRICFLNSSGSSISRSDKTSGYGHYMAGAAKNLILLIMKNSLLNTGYTFRIFDPLEGVCPAETAASSAYGYFTRDRFYDDPADGIGRNDEENLIVRDAFGREIPW